MTTQWLGRGRGPLRKCVPLPQSYAAHVPYSLDSYAWRRLANVAVLLSEGRLPARRRLAVLTAAFSCPQVTQLPPYHLLGGRWTSMTELWHVLLAGPAPWWTTVLLQRSHMEDRATAVDRTQRWRTWACDSVLRGGGIAHKFSKLKHEQQVDPFSGGEARVGQSAVVCKAQP
eukprot:6051350-Amphidinium_carterae.1